MRNVRLPETITFYGRASFAPCERVYDTAPPAHSHCRFSGVRRLQTVAAHAGFRRYFSNTAWILSEQVVRLLVGVLVGVWVARYLGPERFGIFSYVLAFVAIFGSVAKLGLDGVVVREMVNKPMQRVAYLGSAFWLKVFGAGITLGLAALATTFTTNDQSTTLYVLIIVGSLLFQSFEVIDFYFQALVLSRFVSLCRIFQLLISSVLKVYLILSEADLLWFVVVIAVDQATLAISLVLAYLHHQRGHFFKRFDVRISRELLRDSWPLIFSGLLVMIYMRIDQVMIKEMLGAREVGVYSAAVRLSEVWFFIPAVIVRSLFPAIVSAKRTDAALYYCRIQRLYSILGWLAIIIAVPVSLFSDRLVSILYGVQYREAAPVLAILVWAGIFAFLGLVSGKWFLTENLQGLNTANTAVGAVLNILLNLFLIPRYGINGAAFATLLSYSVAAYFMNLAFHPTRANFLRMTKSVLLPFAKN